MVKLGDVATYINGYAFKPTDWTTKGLPIIRIQDLTGSAYQTNYYDGIVAEKYKVVAGDVLISWSASLGVYVWDKEDAVLNQHIFKVVFDKTTVNKSFFVHQVRSILDKAGNETHGATMKHLTKPVFDSLEFYLPSDNVQYEIAITFDKIDLMIAQRKQQLQKLDELVKSRFVEMFGDLELGTCNCSVLKLKDLSHKISDGVHTKPNYTNYGKPFLSVVNINRRKVDFTDCKYVSEEDYEKMIKSTHPQKGDVLYTKVGATYGIPAFVDTDEEFCLYVSVCLIKPVHEKINSRFLAIQMDMPFVKHQADKRIKGIGVPDLHLNQIREFDIICPGREQQNQFVDFVQQIDKSKLSVQKSLDKLKILKKALMQKYFG